MNATGSNSARMFGQHNLSNVSIHIIMTIGTLFSIVPFILVTIISFSSENSIIKNGYSFFPKEWSMEAYKYLFADSTSVLRAYGITIFVTIVGTLASLLIGTMVAYTMSRKDYPYRKFLTFFVVFTILFNGGLVPWYLVYSSIFHIKDTLFALIVPLLLNGFNVIIMRTFFSNTVPESLIESAYLDGAGEFRIYWQIVLPLSLPVIATIGFMTALSYWNDWYTSLIFINNSKLVSLQYLMTKALLNIQNLKLQTDLTTDMLKALGDMPSESIRMAMAVVGVGPMLFIFPLFQKYFISGLTIGAVKG
jgi:putative aldouronate transport system permease protein